MCVSEGLVVSRVVGDSVRSWTCDWFKLYSKQDVLFATEI